MKQIIFLTLALTKLMYSAGQVSKPYILKSKVDSFNYSDAGFTNKFAFGDTLSFRTSYYQNIFKISTDIDSLQFSYDTTRKPFKQGCAIEIKSPSKTQVIYLNFFETPCWFTSEHIKSSINKVDYQIPEVFELANVVYALTNSSKNNSIRTLKNTRYYQDVQNYFKNFKDDSLIRKLEFPYTAQGIKDYYNFRDNSICFKISDGKIIPNNEYFAVTGDVKDNLFAKDLPLVNEFYHKSNFNKFFREHHEFYDSLIVEEKKYMPARKMWNWLKKNFDRQIDAYKIIFSPLIRGSHETQNFSWFPSPRNLFTEVDMFVSGTRGVASNPKLNEDEKEGIASGIVFTEIDHNYCNPVSSKYEKQIDSIFSNRDQWVNKTGDVEVYAIPMAIFNEYITHAVYILYASDQFDHKDFDIVKKNRVDLMVRTRKYFKFEEFADELLLLYKHKNPNEKVSDLFLKIIAWCKNQH
jgi:hypothetical protein